MNPKYKSWLTSLDSDNFAMFIKTWFAYLASIHELVNVSLLGEEKEQAADTRGDKFFLDTYREKILNTIALNDIAKSNILSVYEISDRTIQQNYPQYYFESYYKRIIPSDFAKDDIRSFGKDDYKLNIHIKKDEIFIGILIINEVIKDKIKTQYVKIDIPLIPKETKLEILKEERLFYQMLRTSLKEKMYKNIKPAETTKAFSEVQVKFDIVIQYIITEFERANLHKLIYVKWCDRDNIIEKDIKEWFHGFCYNLRNILFHRIIDPFDSDWSTIMKTSYQGLREMLLLNITELEKEGTSM